MSFAEGHSTLNRNRKKLSVVLPFRSVPQCLDWTVRSLQKQTLDPALWEIVVVDDDSGLPVGSLLDDIGGEVTTRVVTAERNVGRAAARNLGASNAEGDILVFHDADMVIAPDSVQRNYEFHQRFPGSVYMGARFESSWLTLNRVMAGDTTPPESPVEFDQRERIPHESLAKTRAPWLWVYSNSLSLPKSMLLEVGGFDESFQGWGPEDLELGYRLYVHSGRRPEIFTYDSKTISYHIPHYAEWSKNHRSMQRNTEYFIQKHGMYDVEVFSYSSEATASLKIPIYEEMVGRFLEQGLGVVTTGILDLVPQDVPSLVVGTWPADGPSPSGKTIRYDHSRPVSEDNKHLFGIVTLLEDRTLEAVVNVDFWRFLLPFDLNKLVEESLRVAQRLVLVQTHGSGDGPLSSCATVDYVADMLGHNRSVTRSTVDGADVLHVT
ncbi:glycosyltransferase family 2 protein [Lentzea sp. E54]|uniref:glycosyltransferase family 2 protein n=1 Tax=Lentzea xerophila TaxID=3435883 RepID=UPI003DA390E0